MNADLAVDAPVADEAPAAAAPDARTHRLGDVSIARLRVRVQGVRTLLQNGLMNSGDRIIGRLGHSLPHLAPGAITEETPALSLLLNHTRAHRVFDAAAAALMANEIAQAISPEALARLPVSAEAREFALRHRYLALADDMPVLAEGIEELRDHVVACWASRLPVPLDDEVGVRPVAPLLPPPPRAPSDTPPPAPEPALRKLWTKLWAEKQQVLPVLFFPTGEDKIGAALDAAIVGIPE
ncbi:hypothetical protein [Paracoccus sp. (in: a-proteobacteria)]|uniref:hypothetical protein n=1 Tax=Paracoccus sp. TaxID=267 RepID=UPI003A851E12